jgi:hypothetical protein
MFTIEKGVPLPERTERQAAYPFRLMEVGDSFVVGDELAVKRARAAAYAFSKRTGNRFACRRVGDGWRFWRVS